MLLALLPAILWGSFANHLSFALAAAPGDPTGVWNSLLSMQLVTGDYRFRLTGVLVMAFCTWSLLFLHGEKLRELEKRANGPCRNPPQPFPVGTEVFLPSQA